MHFQVCSLLEEEKNSAKMHHLNLQQIWHAPHMKIIKEK